MSFLPLWEIEYKDPSTVDREDDWFVSPSLKEMDAKLFVSSNENSRYSLIVTGSWRESKDGQFKKAKGSIFSKEEKESAKLTSSKLSKVQLLKAKEEIINAEEETFLSCEQLLKQ